MNRRIIGKKQKEIRLRKICTGSPVHRHETRTFYCGYECGILGKEFNASSCYCPECAKRECIAGPGDKDYCKTRFG